MEKLSLVALLDEDKEMVSASLARDPSIPAAQATLEKAVDRVMYRYGEACGDEALATSAQHILQAMKNTLPVMDTVGEVRTWNRQAQGQKNGLNFGPMSVALLVGGLVLVIAAVLGTLISGRFSGALAFIKAMLPAGLGSAALFFAGIQAARPRDRKRAPEGNEDVRTEYLADTDKVWRDMKAMLLVADNALGSLREQEEIRRQKDSADQNTSPIPAEEIELFSSLLEMAGASSDPDARDMVSSIRFYLHAHGVDAVDYSPEKASWFELLPASRGGTIRPALSSGGRLVKKGLASAN